MPGTDFVFPQGDFDKVSQYHDEMHVVPRGGLTKRELFAALIMAGGAGLSIAGSHHVPTQAAKEAVEKADALIAELER